MVHGVFVLAGLIPAPKAGEKRTAGAKVGAHLPYHPHVLRGTNLSIAKNAGFPDNWAEFLAGHSTGSKEHYPTEEEIGKKWLEKCEPEFCFLKTKLPEDLTNELEQNKK
jgi:hypothetical protein